MRKRVNGNVVFTDQVFIPRSELDWKFQERKLTDDQVFSMRRFIDGVEEIKDELEKLNHQLKGLQDHRVKLELIISQYEQERKEIIAQHEKKRKILEEIIEREITNELKKEENLVQIRLNEVEMERNKKKIKEEKDKRATEIRSLRKSMQYFLNGAIFMAIATIVLLFLDGILGIAGYILLALTGGFVVYFIIRRSRLATAIKSAQSELDEQVKELNGKTEDCKTRIDVIKKKVRKKLINSFKPKKEGLEHELEINLENLSKHHNVGEVKANVDALDKEIKLVNTKIENLKKRLSGSIATKPFAEYKKSILYKKFNY
jgi:chromosome segregation ATPase